MSSVVLGHYGDITIIRKDGVLAEVNQDGSIEMMEPGILYLDYMGNDPQ